MDTFDSGDPTELCSVVQGNFPNHLAGDSRSADFKTHREHVDHCRHCWGCWWRFRWEVAKRHPSFKEMEEYFGHGVEPKDYSWALAHEWELHMEENSNPAQFYENSLHYLITLLVWTASGQRPNYVRKALPFLVQFDIGTILDFGCGIGTDLLSLSASGFLTTGFEINRESLRFLNWRIKQLGSQANVVSDLPVGISLDCLWLMDVIEHLQQPVETLHPLIKGRCSTIICSTEHFGTSGGRHPFHYPESYPKFTKFLSSQGYENLGTSDIDVWRKKAR